MKTELIKVNPAYPEPEKIKHAADALKRGKLVVFPTETVYGIAADAKNKNAIGRLRKLKDRPKEPFSFHIAEKSDLKKLSCIVDKDTKKLIDKFWPGPLTLILKIKADENIGVRMPAHPVAKPFLKKTGPWVVAPSANFKDQTPATDARQVLRDLNGLVDIVIDSGKTGSGISSTVLDMTQVPPKMLREGSIRKKTIEGIIGRVASN